MQAARTPRSKRATTKTEPALININVDDDAESFQHQALEIRQPGENFDPAVEPQSGEEFLMKMLYERKRCPAVVVKRPKTVLTTDDFVMQNNESEFSDCSPSSLRPTPEWKAFQVTDFLATRDRVDLMRQELKAQNYDEELEQPLTNDSMEWKTFCLLHQPLLSTILRINQRSLEQLLEMICEWLREGEQEITADLSEPKRNEEAIASSSAAGAAAVLDDNSTLFDLSNSQQWLGSWLYAALTCLHLPLEPDVHSTLRDIARVCIRLRNRLLEQELEKAVPYNLFIYIIAKVFDQLDFADFV